VAKKWREKKIEFDWMGERGGTVSKWPRAIPAAYELPLGINLHAGGGVSQFGPTSFYLWLSISQTPGSLDLGTKRAARFPTSSSHGGSEKRTRKSSCAPSGVTEFGEWSNFAAQFTWSEIEKRLKRYYPEGWTNRPRVCVGIRLCRWENLPYHHLLLPERFFNPKQILSPESISECMKEGLLEVLQDVRDHVNDKLIDSSEYLRTLHTLSRLTQQVTQKQSLAREDLEELNELRSRLMRKPTVVHDFLYEFWASLAQELCQRRIAGQCRHCGLLMTFRSSKRYCTLKQENRDCSKAARNQRYRTRQKNPSFPAR